MPYIDTHTHILDEAFNEDREEIIVKLKKSNFNLIYEILCSSKDWDNFKKLDKYENFFYFAFGIHPEYIEENKKENFLKLKEILKLKKALFIGEIGFDYYWDNNHKEEQKSLLFEQLKISKELNKPCVFHIRNGKNLFKDNAYDDFIKFIKNNWGYENKKRGILHSFSGNYENAKQAIDLGLYLGINGTFTYPKNEGLRETVKKVGIKNIVLETDSPYLPPQSIRGKKNNPLSVIEIASVVANYLKEEFSKIEEEIYQNSIPENFNC